VPGITDALAPLAGSRFASALRYGLYRAEDDADSERRTLRPAMTTMKQKLGCWLHERWKTEVVLHPAAGRLARWQWGDLCNRSERLLRGPGDARECMWQDSSLLSVADSSRERAAGF